MKANRKTMLGVAFAVAVIALAGVGYAAVAYESSITTTGTMTASNVYSIMESNSSTGGVASGKTVTDNQTISISYDTARTGNGDPTYTFRDADKLYIGFKIVPHNDAGATYKFKTSTITFTNLPSGLSAAWDVVNGCDGTESAVITGVAQGAADPTGTLSASTVYYLRLTLSGTTVTGVTDSDITINAITMTAVRIP